MFAPIETWVFDLDNTLYPASCDLFAEIDIRMRLFVAAFLRVGEDEAHRIQKDYFHRYGTTLRGLMTCHGVDPHAFLADVHSIDLGAIAPDPALDRVLARLPGRKLIFTNATRAHADRVIGRLGIARHFEAVFDIEDAGFVPKPDPAVYASLIARFGLEPRRTAMIDDIAWNLVPAADLGMTTVWIRNESPWSRPGFDASRVHHVVEDLAAWLETAVA